MYCVWQQKSYALIASYALKVKLLINRAINNPPYVTSGWWEHFVQQARATHRELLAGILIYS